MNTHRSRAPQLLLLLALCLFTALMLTPVVCGRN